MKAILKPILFAILVIGGLKGIAQCAAPNFSYTINPGGQVTFTDYSYYWDSMSNGPTYIWNFGDGDTVWNSGYTVSHTYASGGNYTVSLEITTPNTTCDSTESQNLQINLCAVGANFTYTQTGFGLYNFSPLNLASLPGSTVLWSFGDGNTSTSTSPTHQYASSHDDTVVLTVTDPTLSCTVSDTFGIIVNLCNYSVNIDTTVLSYGPAVIQFQPSQVNAGYVYNWLFTYPNQNYTNATGATVSNTFNVSGYDSVFLQISDATTGCVANVVNYDYINACGVNAGFTNAGNGLTQSFYTYNYDSLNGGGSNIAGYAWTFTGATPSTGSGSEVDNVVYPAVGTYSACLYLTTANGCLDTICNTVTISPPQYSISGTASKNGGTGFVGTVYLIIQDSVGHLALVDSMSSQIDTAGNGFGYYFGGLQVDTYYVKAALSPADPDYANYLPTYYNGYLTWGTATPVVISNASSNSADIELIAGTNPGGPGFVGGYVSQGAGLVIGGSGNGNARSVGDPLQGVQINLLTSGGEAVAYTYTDINGKYSFPNLALGSYKIYAEQLNKVPVPLDFTLTAENPVDSGANISINSHSATGIDNLSNIQISGVYPNPVIGSLQLQLSSTQNIDATLKLVDVLGRTCLQQAIKIAAGQNTAEVNMEPMAAGIYQLVIQTGTKQITYKVVKAK